MHPVVLRDVAAEHVKSLTAAAAAARLARRVRRARPAEPGHRPASRPAARAVGAGLAQLPGEPLADSPAAAADRDLAGQRSA